MQKIIQFVFFFIFSLNCFAQKDPTTILEKCVKANAQIKQGTYAAHLRVKYLMKSDTFNLAGTCRFLKIPKDTIKGAYFELSSNDVRVLYDGKNKTTIYAHDNFAIVHDCSKYKLKLAGSIYHLLSDYFVSGNTDIGEAIKSPDTKKQLLNDTVIYNVPCYQILLHPVDEGVSENIFRNLFISKANYFLLGEIVNLDAHQHHQFTELFIENFELNKKEATESYGTNVIPSGFFKKNYVPDQLSKLLTAGTDAPDFNLKGLDGNMHSIKNLKGKIVVLYFWDAIDQQSRVRLMPLQKTFEKYKDKNVEVLGLNVSDDTKAQLEKFLQNKNSTFTHLLNAAITSEKYNMLNVPTIYVIGKDGKIVEGFTLTPKENLEAKLENLILKNQ